MLKITNTLSGKKELFSTIDPLQVRLYVCGITPYDYAHLGHGRVYVIFDLLNRLLQFNGYNVTYCRNFTDIDDKLLYKAQAEYNDQFLYKQVAQKYIDAYLQDMEQLNCLPPTYQPKVTDNIPEIITFIQGLIDAGKAYVVNQDVYYSIATFADYGKLSKQKLDDLKTGARVEVDHNKKDPLDFALWKSEPEGTFWKSPWGYGRPGWHIECSALACKFLGEHIDIHGGGMDLIFPHHENEIAQSQGLFGAPFSKYWMHNAFVRINQEKMSKSLGNFFTLRDVFKQFDPMVVRFYYLSHHYRSPLDFSFDDLQALTKSYTRLTRVFTNDIPQATLQEVKSSRVVQQMLEFLADDLNTSGMFGVLFENLAEIEKNQQERSAVKYFLQHILGLSLMPLAEKEIKITAEMEQLIQKREQARLARDFKTADAIRDQLKQLGYDPQDKKI